MTPKQFRDKTIGKSYDFDKFPVYNPFQCWDYFRYFIADTNTPVNTYCALTGYVCDLWKLRDQYGYYDYFEYITDRNKIKNGDWCIWDRGSSHALSHIAMYYNGYALGQNQPKQYVTEKETTFDIIGALRPRFWSIPQQGYAEYFSNDFAHAYKCGVSLNLRAGGDTSYEILETMARGSMVRCYGYYHLDKEKRIWLYVKRGNITGFCCYDYLEKAY